MCAATIANTSRLTLWKSSMKFDISEAQTAYVSLCLSMNQESFLHIKNVLQNNKLISSRSIKADDIKIKVKVGLGTKKVFTLH